MKFLDRLLRKRPDPTSEWSLNRAPMPGFDLAEMRFGPMQFGDMLESASFLGRPDRFEWMQENYCALIYASSGFEIEFDEGLFAYLAFLIGPDNSTPKGIAVEFSQPRLRGGKLDDIQLSAETDQRMIEQLFGAADSSDIDSRETILYFTRQNVTMEFEMNESGRLKRWNLYPKEQ